MQNCKKCIKFSYIASLFIFSVIGCKKETKDTVVLSPRTSFEQSIFYKVIMTIPSPADSARGYFVDSIKVKKPVLRSDPDFFTNIANLSANIIPSFPGFSFGYDDNNNSFPYFAFTSYAFPNVPREFALNTPYEHITIPGSANDYPIFLGAHTGNSGMNYFVNNVYPPDAGFPTSKTYTKIIFTDRSKIVVSTVDTVLLASGKISGYAEKYWGTVNPSKYLQRWDFMVEFTDLQINK